MTIMLSSQQREWLTTASPYPRTPEQRAAVLELAGELVQLNLYREKNSEVDR